MRRSAFTVTMSIILIVVSLFSLVAVGLGMRDVLAIKKYKEEAAKEARANDMTYGERFAPAVEVKFPWA